jgi:diaminopimelate epimerase
MMQFTKYHGTGNDFILIDHEPKSPSALAKQICDRHMGIGADGLIYPSVSQKYDIQFNYYNSDGTIAPMCGNGMRTFVKYLLDEGLIAKTSFVVETLSGPIAVRYIEDQQMIEVDLGQTITSLKQPNLSVVQHQIKQYTLVFDGIPVSFHTVMLGTLHTMVEVEYPIDMEKIGPLLAYHPFFPEATNVNFVTWIDRKHIHVKTYERGAGWTLSCGTGSAASAWLMHTLGKTDDYVNVSVPGGALSVSIKTHVLLIGPAQKIAKGVYDIHE